MPRSYDQQSEPTSLAGGSTVDPLDGLMDEGLASFLAAVKPFHRERRTWPNGFDLDIASYLHDQEPPAEFVTSVRAVLVTPDGVAVLHNPDGSHILPGGRRENGESLLDTLGREVEEETRCRIDNPILLGFVHIRILSAKPDKYPYPHPDVLQVVYVARGLPGSFVGTDPDGWEESVEFVAPDDLKERPLGENELIYLNEGLRLLDAV